MSIFLDQLLCEFIFVINSTLAFVNRLSPTFVIVDKIKCEVRLWVLAGARKLGDLMPGE
jgi:hypothetical protein